MNKSELAAVIAQQHNISKSLADRILDTLVDSMTETLKNGGTIQVHGFGSFYVGQRAARTGRNPRTGEAIKIQEARQPKFRAGKKLKEIVN